MKYFYLHKPMVVAIIMTILSVVFIYSLPASAVETSRVIKDQLCQSAINSGDPACTATDGGINAIVQSVLTILVRVVGVVSIVIIVISGIRFALSNGDPQATANARNGIIYAVIGIAVALVAQGIITFVLNKT